MKENTPLDEQPAVPAEEESEPPNPEQTSQLPAGRKPARFFKIIGGIFLGLIVCLFVLVAVAIWYEHRWPKPDGDFDTWDFGKNGAKGVTVSFTSPDGMVYIQGYIGKRPTQFMVDTGSYASTIPKRLRVGNQYADDNMSWDASHITIWSHPVFVSCVSIGDSTIHNFSAEIPDRYTMSSRPICGVVANQCILGNSALSHVVVKIDYVSRQITFQPPQKQMVPLTPKSSSSYRFTWPSGDTSLKTRSPFVSGEINHYPAKIILDTGTSYPVIIPQSLSELLIKKKSLALTGRKSEIHEANSSTQAAETTSLAISMKPDSKTQHFMMFSNAQVVSGWSDPSCVLIGSDNFGSDIVTIDYPHRTLLITQAGTPLEAVPISDHHNHDYLGEAPAMLKHLLNSTHGPIRAKMSHVFTHSDHPRHRLRQHDH